MRSNILFLLLNGKNSVSRFLHVMFSILYWGPLSKQCGSKFWVKSNMWITLLLFIPQLNAYNFTKMIRKIWPFFWYQNLILYLVTNLYFKSVVRASSQYQKYISWKYAKRVFNIMTVISWMLINALKK